MAQSEQPSISSHEFNEATTVFYNSSPEEECGWYFSDNNGVLFGPIRNETAARQMLAELSLWFKNKKTVADA